KADGKAQPVVIDFDGIDQRILALPVAKGLHRRLQAGAAGQVFFLEGSPETPEGDGPKGATLKRFDLGKRKSEIVLAGVDEYYLSADGKKALVHAPPESWSIIDALGKPEPGKGKLKVDAIEVRVDPRAEWTQMLDEAWRINRDYFYD